jgi:hypothetical protein
MLTEDKIKAIAEELAVRLPSVIKERKQTGGRPIAPKEKEQLCFDVPDVVTALRAALRVAGIESREDLQRRHD